MNKFVILAALVILVGLTAALVPAPKTGDKSSPKTAQLLRTAAVAKAPVVIDLSKPLPSKLDLTVGQSVVFENAPGGAVDFVASATDSKGILLEPRPNNTQWTFQAKRAGSGQIQLRIRPVQGPSIKRTISVTVAAAAVKSTSKGFCVDLSKGAPPKTLDLVVGQRLSFVGKDIVNVSVKATDAQSGDLLKKIKFSPSMVKGFSFYGLFTADRVGTGEVELKTYDDKGKLISTTIIPVTVK